MLVTSRSAFAGVLIALVAATGWTAPVPAERVKTERELAAFATKLHGSWSGDAGCQGTLALQANGTYEWKLRGPGGDTDAGVWEMRGDAQSPALWLKCKTSDDPERVGTGVQMKVTQVTESKLTLLPAGSAPLEFTREMQPPR